MANETLGGLERLSWMPDRADTIEQGDRIGGQYWYDVEFSGGSISNVVLTDVTVNGVETYRTETIVTSTPYAVLPTDYVLTVILGTPSASIITLPSPTISRSIIVKDGAGDASSNNITIDGNGETIDGQGSYVISADYGAVEIIYNGIEWNVIGQTSVGGGSGAVDSVNGQTGVVVLDIDDIGGVYTDGVTITGDGTSGDPLVSVGSSTAWGEITGTLSDQTDLQSALDLKAPLANPVFTGIVQATTIQADTSAGLLLESNSGNDVLLLGAGGGANATAYGGWNFDAATANTIASFGASKTLTSLSTTTYPSLTELSYVKGVTSAIQTQIDAKQPTGNYITALTGEVTASGPGSASATISNSAVIGKVITGFSAGAGTVSATDTILQAINKIVGNITAIVSGVSSVFGRTGAVTAQSGDYNTSQVTENTNLYFTDERAQDAVGGIVDSTLVYVDATPVLKRAAISGDVVIADGSNSASLTNSAVTGQALTGFVAASGTVAATDTILEAIEKVAGNTSELESDKVPYTGATNNVYLGANALILGDGFVAGSGGVRLQVGEVEVPVAPSTPNTAEELTLFATAAPGHDEATPGVIASDGGGFWYKLGNGGNQTSDDSGDGGNGGIFTVQLGLPGDGVDNDGLQSKFRVITEAGADVLEITPESFVLNGIRPEFNQGVSIYSSSSGSTITQVGGANNSPVTTLSLYSVYSGTVTTGFGNGIEFNAQTGGLGAYAPIGNIKYTYSAFSPDYVNNIFYVRSNTSQLEAFRLSSSASGLAAALPRKLTLGTVGLTAELELLGLTSGSSTIKVPAAAGTGTVFQLPADNGTNNYVLTTNGSGVTSWNLQTVSGSNVTGYGTGINTFLIVPTSANLRAAITDETGTGNLVFSDSPTFTGGVQADEITANTFFGFLDGVADGANYANEIVTANEATDTTCFPTFVTSSGSFQGALKTNTTFTYNSNTSTLAATNISGGNVTGNIVQGTSIVGPLTGNASTATALQTARNIGGVSFNGTADIVPQTIQVVDAASDTTTFPMLAGSATGNLQPMTDAGLSYNASTNALTSTTFIGALTGNASTATSATSVVQGAGTAPLIGTANINTTAVGNVGTGTDDLITYSLPANSLNANGRGVRITVWGQTANNANAKTLALLFGSTTIFTRSMTTSTNNRWSMTAVVFRTGSNAQDYAGLSFFDGATVVANTGGTSAQTDSGAIVIKCTGAATSNNDIVQEGMLIEFIS